MTKDSPLHDSQLTSKKPAASSNPYKEFFEQVSRTALAPMAGITDRSYRRICQELGCELVYTEMVSATGLSYGSQPTWDLALPHLSETRVIVQLFGHDPQSMAEQAFQIQKRLGIQLFGIDVNMACPVAKVTKKGEGSALMKDPECAQAIIQSLTHAVSVPISAKIRIGQTVEHPTCFDFAQRLQEAGASAIALHGRSVGQGYRGSSNRDLVGVVASSLEIPVIGSGDVTSQTDIDDYCARGCAGALVARGSYGNPWIFGCSGEPSIAERFSVVRRHLEYAKDDDVPVGRMRKIVSFYLKGLPEAAQWRGRVMKALTYTDLIDTTYGYEAWYENTR